MLHTIYCALFFTLLKVASCFLRGIIRGIRVVVVDFLGREKLVDFVVVIPIDDREILCKKSVLEILARFSRKYFSNVGRLGMGSDDGVERERDRSSVMARG